MDTVQLPRACHAGGADGIALMRPSEAGRSWLENPWLIQRLRLVSFADSGSTEAYRGASSAPLISINVSRSTGNWIR
jgi:hypothetical protein